MTLSGNPYRNLLKTRKYVLIPLLVDDPLREQWEEFDEAQHPCLNPSFSGWPSPGFLGLMLKEVE